MQIGVYRKNVMKTLQIKPARLGLKLTSKNNKKTAVAVAVVGLNVEIGQLLNSLSPYICGLQMTDGIKASAFERFGQVGYYLTMFCRILKVKMPTASKKAKLSGTRTAALLQLNHLGNDMLSLLCDTFLGPKMKVVEKIVVLPKQGGIKEPRMVAIIDQEAEAALTQERMDQYRGLVMAAVDLYWRLCSDIFGVAPATVFDASMSEIQKRFPVQQSGKKVKKAVKSVKSLSTAKAVSSPAKKPSDHVKPKQKLFPSMHKVLPSKKTPIGKSHLKAVKKMAGKSKSKK
jgi:hypothetical protein